MMPTSSESPTVDTGAHRDAPNAVGSCPCGGAARSSNQPRMNQTPWTPPRRSTASWIVYDLGDTVFRRT